MTFEEALESHGGFLFTNVGSSMWPLIRQGQDVLTIEKRPEGRLRKYDIPLYRADGKYILHRILRVRERDYLVAGDHNFRRETVTDGQIIGILTGITRDGKRVPLSGVKYRLYLFLWCDLYPVRAAVLLAAAYLRGAVNRIK